jgi:hypothetical protein
VAHVRSGLIYETGTIYQYSVNGWPRGHEAMIANEAASSPQTENSIYKGWSLGRLYG